jgi:hypothetical protein
MSKKSSPLTRAWHATLMLFGIVVLLSLIVSILARIAIWLIIGSALALVIAALVWWHRRQNRW